MSLYKLGISTLVFCLLGIAGNPVSNTPVMLRGTVTDAVEGAALAGVDVILNVPGAAPKQTISDSSGNYSFGELERDKTGEVKFSRAGYLPYPRKYPIQLSKEENRQDARLLQDTHASDYWTTWGAKVKITIEAVNIDQQKAGSEYEKFWLSLQNAGVSAEGQVEAAHQLTSVAPVAWQSQKIKAFALVNANDLETFQENLRLALEGKDSLARQETVSPQVAAMLAADTLTKWQPTPKATAKFSKQFEAVWGRNARNDLAMNMQVQSKPHDFTYLNRLEPGQVEQQ